jgi:DNA repair photolyase
MNPNQPSLFSTLNSPAKGIAGWAAESPVTADGDEVEYHSMTARSILNRTPSPSGEGFHWTINPYRGCEFASRYCYARDTHEFMEVRGPSDCAQKIFAKSNAAQLLEQELRRLPARETIAIGTATDPYQPIERREKISRGLLEVLARDMGDHRISIVTKSVLILRDIELLQQVGDRHELTVNLTITTDEMALARKLEPRAPRPDLRFHAVRRLRESGIRVGVLCTPAIPGINDSQPQLDRMAYLASAARASFFSAGALFLKPGARQVFESFIEEDFPHLLADQQRRFVQGAFQSSETQRELDVRVGKACSLHGLATRSDDGVLAKPQDNHSTVKPMASPPRRIQSQFSLRGFLPGRAMPNPMQQAKSA